MTYYRRVGDIPRKRHSLHRVDGARRRRGDGRRGGLLRPVEPALPPPLAERHREHRRRRHRRCRRSRRTSRSPPTTCARRSCRPGRPTRSRRGLRCSATTTCSCSYVTATTTSPLYRNAVGDELVYVQSGSATLESVFGSLPVSAGDYVVVPTGVTHRWVVGADAGLSSCSCSSRAATSTSRRSTSPRRASSPTARRTRERDLRGPDGPLLVEGEDVEVLVRTRAGFARHVHRRPPLRRRRLGRLRLSVGAQHPRLRADRRGASTSRRPCTRRSPAPGSSSARSCRASTTSDPTP